MRRAWLMFVVACGHPGNHAVPPSQPPVATPDAAVAQVADAPEGDGDPDEQPHPLPTDPPLLRAGKLFLVDVDAQPVACSEWTVDGSAGTGSITRNGVIVSFEIDEHAITISGASARIPGSSDEESGLEGSCNIVRAVRENAEAFELGDARWFKTQAACDKAVKDKARVALDLHGCALRPFAPAPERAAARDRLEKALAAGTSLYAPNGKGCSAVTFAPSKARYDDYLEGTLAAAPLKFHYLFHKGAGQLSLIGPHAKPGQDMECMRAFDIVGDKDGVQVGRTLYFTEAACKAHLTGGTERAKWLAPSPPEPPPSPDDVPAEPWAELAADEC